jgi:hypothetical protein
MPRGVKKQLQPQIARMVSIPLSIDNWLEKYAKDVGFASVTECIREFVRQAYLANKEGDVPVGGKKESG